MPRGYTRLQMTLYRKLWIVSTDQASWDDVFYAKPPHVRKLLQEDMTQVRYDQDEEIWLRTLNNLIRAMREIMCLPCTKFAVTDLRFLVEMRGIKARGGKIIHIEASDQLETIAPELRGHRSETELQSPEVKMLRDAYLFNDKRSLAHLQHQGELILQDWGWR